MRDSALPWVLSGLAAVVVLRFLAVRVLPMLHQAAQALQP